MEMDSALLEKQTNGSSTLITDKLLTRESYRQQECDRKRKEKVNTSAATEQASYFKTTVAEKRSKIEKAMDALTSGDLDKSQLTSQFDTINQDLKSLERYVASSTLFLKVYDVRRASEVIEGLKTKYNQLESELLPKKKFGFKSRKAAVSSVNGEIRDTTDSKKETKPIVPEPYHFVDNNFGFFDKKGEHLTLLRETIHKKDVSLSNLEDCTVELLGSSSTLALISLKNCRILAGPVATSVFVEHCSGCVVVVPCQQLRVHDTRQSHFYIHVTSRAIIEDTTQVSFAPYNWQYQHLDADFLQAGLDKTCNHWDSIDDFNWLAIDKPSPNWCLLSEDERVGDWKLNAK